MEARHEREARQEAEARQALYGTLRGRLWVPPAEPGEPVKWLLARDCANPPKSLD